MINEIKPYSVFDPKNSISFKAKVKTNPDNSLICLFEILQLNRDNTMKDSVEYFMSLEDFDYLQYLYTDKSLSHIPFKKTKGSNGVARGIRVSVDYDKYTPGHLVFSIVKGTGSPSRNGFTKLEQIESNIIFNMSHEQAIKMFKYIERMALITMLNKT